MGIRQSVINNLSKALFDTELISTRVSLAFAEFLWAVMLFWPGDTFARPTYSIMAGVTNEVVWAFIFLLSSAFQLSVVAFNQIGKDWAQVFANWNAALWVFVVGASLLSVYPPPAAMGGEIALASAAVWVWVRPLIVRSAYQKASNINSCVAIYDRRSKA